MTAAGQTFTRRTTARRTAVAPRPGSEGRSWFIIAGILISAVFVLPVIVVGLVSFLQFRFLREEGDR
jgi:hypothetical protein